MWHIGPSIFGLKSPGRRRRWRRITWPRRKVGPDRSISCRSHPGRHCRGEDGRIKSVSVSSVKACSSGARTSEGGWSTWRPVRRGAGFFKRPYFPRRILEDIYVVSSHPDCEDPRRKLVTPVFDRLLGGRRVGSTSVQTLCRAREKTLGSP